MLRLSTAIETPTQLIGPQAATHNIPSSRPLRQHIARPIFVNKYMHSTHAEFDAHIYSSTHILLL